MNRRRITWIIHNTLVAPIIVVRLPLFALAVVGEWAGKVLMIMPGMRRFNGWGGW
jgi:hypothetical protein